MFSLAQKIASWVRSASCWRLVTISSVTIACTKYLFCCRNFWPSNPLKPLSSLSSKKRRGCVIGLPAHRLWSRYTPKPKSRLCVPTPETLTIYIGSCIYVTLVKVYHPPKKKRKKEALSLTLETMTPQKEANTRSAASVFVPDEPLPSFGDSAKLLPPKDC